LHARDLIKGQGPITADRLVELKSGQLIKAEQDRQGQQAQDLTGLSKQEAERLKAVHEARVKIVPRV
jgi:hypothetical protein